MGKSEVSKMGELFYCHLPSLLADNLRENTLLVYQYASRKRSITPLLIAILSVLGILIGYQLAIIHRGLKPPHLGGEETSTTPSVIYSPSLTPSPSPTPLPVDTDSPIIERVEYSPRVLKGELQTITVYVRELNPSNEAILELNGALVKLSLTESSGEVVVYRAVFDPSTIISSEREVSGVIVVVDKYENSANYTVSFIVNLEAPVITSFNASRVDIGEYEVSAKIIDENLEKVILRINSEEIPVLSVNGEYKAIVKTFQDVEITLYAEDKYGMNSTAQIKIEFSRDNPNVYYAVQKGIPIQYAVIFDPLDADKTQQPSEQQLVNLCTTKLSSINDSVFALSTYRDFVKNIVVDGEVTDDEVNRAFTFTDYIVKADNYLYNLIDTYQKYGLKVSNPLLLLNETAKRGLILGFDKETATKSTVRLIVNYVYGLIQPPLGGQMKLPESFGKLSVAVRFTQGNGGEDFGNFPLVFTFPSADGNVVVYIPDVGLATHLLVHLVYWAENNGYPISKFPEMNEGLSMMALGAAVSAEEINYFERKVTGKSLTFYDLLDLLQLNFKIHIRAAPQFGGGNSVYNRLFPWYDSRQFKQIQPDGMTRWIQGVSTFRLPVEYVNPQTGEIERGVKATKAALLDLQRLIPKFDEIYRNDTKINYPILGNLGPDAQFFIMLQTLVLDCQILVRHL